MSHEKGLRRYLAFDEFDRTIARIGLVACVLLLGLRLLADQILLVIIPVAGGAGLLLYLHVRPTHVRAQSSPGTQQNVHSPDPNIHSPNRDIDRHDQQRSIAYGRTGHHAGTDHILPTLPGRVAGYLPAVVFAAVAVLLLQVQLAGGRTTTSVLLGGAIGSVLLVQILFAGERHLSPSLLLVQILLVTIAIRLTALFGTPGFIGVDVWSHVPVLVQGIIDAGSLEAIADDKYVMAPIYHLVGAFGGLVFDSARTGTYLTIGLVVPLATLLVYVTTRTLVTARWALLATALFAFSEHIIRWGIHVIPTSLGVVFFLGALLSLTRLYRTDDGRYVVLLLLFSLASVFTHQVSTVVVLVLLGAAAVAGLLDRFGRFGGVDSPYSGHVVLVFVFTAWTTLISWLLTPWSEGSIFFWRMLETLEVAIGEFGFLNLASEAGAGGGGAGASTTGYPGLFGQLVPVIDWLGFAIVFATMVVGALFLLGREDSPSLRLTYIVAVTACFVIAFGLSLFGFRVLMPGRWMAFLAALLAIIGAVGVAHIGRNATLPVAVAVFLTIALVFPMAMVVTEKATKDSPVLEQEYPRFAYNEAEIAAVETIGTVQPPEHTAELGTDHPYQTVFERVGGYDTAPTLIGPDGLASDAAVVYREYQSVAPTLFHEPGVNETAPPITRNSQEFTVAEICPEDRNHPYANDEVMLCTELAGDGDDE